MRRQRREKIEFIRHDFCDLTKSELILLNKLKVIKMEKNGEIVVLLTMLLNFLIVIFLRG